MTRQNGKHTPWNDDSNEEAQGSMQDKIITKSDLLTTLQKLIYDEPSLRDIFEMLLIYSLSWHNKNRKKK